MSEWKRYWGDPTTPPQKQWNVFMRSYEQDGSTVVEIVYTQPCLKVHRFIHARYDSSTDSQFFDAWEANAHCVVPLDAPVERIVYCLAGRQGFPRAKVIESRDFGEALLSLGIKEWTEFTEKKGAGV